MSLAKLTNKLRAIGVDLAWMHWNRLGVRGTGPMLQCSVDPEALILLTALVGDREVRLWEGMTAWLWKYESLIPMDRFKKISSLFKTHPHILPRLANFLQNNLDKKTSARWDFLIKKADSPASDKFNISKKLVENRLQSHEWIIRQNLLLQLRYLFGPSVRADILYFVLVVSSQEKTPNEITLSIPALKQALHYDPSAIYRAVRSLVAAGVFDELELADRGERDKFYSLATDNAFFASFARHTATSVKKAPHLLDTHHIRWKPLLEIVIEAELLADALDKIAKDKAGESDPLIKTKLNRFLIALKTLAQQAKLPLKMQMPPKLPLKDISLNEFSDCINNNIDSIISFLEQPKKK